MARVGSHLCNGCDECRTRTVAADEDAHDYPCCEHFPDNKAPCKYAVIWRCKAGVSIGQLTSCYRFGGPGTDVKEWLVSHPVIILRKQCYVGCKWVQRVECDLGSPVYDGGAIDVVPDAINYTFPPAHLTEGVLGYHEADYHDSDADVDTCIAIGDTNIWELEVSGLPAGDVSLTLVRPDIVAWAAGLGKTIPVYENVEEWSPWGRNRMRIVAGREDFPMLPLEICIVATDESGAGENPCDDQDSRCACNDFAIGDSGQILVDIDGCDGISGLHSVNVLRYKSPDVLPCGVEYPSPNPCGVFWGTLSTGEGCENEEGNWSGDVGFLIWCDGETYREKVYCYDLDLECWVLMGEATITLVDLTCHGTVYLEMTLPPLNCCCPAPGEPCCTYADLPATGAISDGTNTYTITKGVNGGGNTTYTNPGPITLCGFESTAVSVTCVDGVWTFDGAEMPCVGTMTWDGDCEAIILTFDCFGCTITATI